MIDYAALTDEDLEEHYAACVGERGARADRARRGEDLARLLAEAAADPVVPDDTVVRAAVEAVRADSAVAPTKPTGRRGV